MFSDTAQAQSSRHIQARSYEVEGVRYYDVSNCIPGSQIAFYSETYGGHLLTTCTANKSGAIQFKDVDHFKPALVLNPNKVNSGVTKGNGTSAKVNTCEFVLDHLNVTSSAGRAVVNWDGAVCDVSKYSFDILKKIDDGSYQKVETIPASSSKLTGYVFTDNVAEDEDVSYAIRVSSKSGTAYTSRDLDVENATNAKLFPTVSSDVLNVVLSKRSSAGSYKIIDVQGREVHSGTLSQERSVVQVKDLVAGNYIMQIFSDKDKPAALRFIKQ